MRKRNSQDPWNQIDRIRQSHSRIERFIMAWMFMVPVIGIAILAGLAWLVWILLKHFGVL